MGYFNEFPWTNFHGFNLDWILKTVKDSETKVNAFSENLSNLVIEEIEKIQGSIAVNVMFPPPPLKGAKGDYDTNQTDDIEALQAIHDYLVLRGGGVMYFPLGVYGISEPFILDSNITIVGETMNGVTIKAMPTFTGTAVIKNKDFDSLTGQNYWFVSEGVKYGFAIKDITIDGNTQIVKGTQLYAKGFFIDRLRIANCNAGGWYSECGYKGGQSEIADMPESIIGGVYIYDCTGYGMDYLGPHDGYIREVFISGLNKSGTKGMRLLIQPNVYSGGCELGHLHLYGLGSEGFYANTKFLGDSVISENVDLTPFVLDATHCQLSRFENYGGVNDGETIMKINGSQNHIASVDIRYRDTTTNATGIDITGNENFVKGTVYGLNTNGKGCKINGRGNNADLNIYDFNASGGVGFDFNDNDNARENRIVLNLRNCDTAIVSNSTGSAVNVMDIRGYSNATLISGEFGLRDEIRGGLADDSGVTKYFQDFLTAIGEIDLTIDTAQDITINHNLVYIPNFRKTTVTLYDINVDNVGFDYIRLKSVSATNVIVTVKLSTVGTGTGSVLVNASI